MKKNIKIFTEKYLKTVLCSIIMASLLIGTVVQINAITVNRDSEGCVQLMDFYDLDDNSVDVLFVGSSHVYYSVNTCRLYDNYGMTSYLLASPGQPVWIGYYLLKEALKTQTPKLIVYDVLTLSHDDSDFGNKSLETVMSMKPSITKWQAIKAVNKNEQLLEEISAFLSFPYYHTRYSELSHRRKLIRYNGYKPTFEKISSKEYHKWYEKKIKKTDAITKISEYQEGYLMNIIQLCEEKHIPLLLVNSPAINNTKHKQEVFNYVKKVAKENNIHFINGNDLLEEMNIVFKDDLLEASHLNYYGAIKYTDYVGKFIKDHYKIPVKENVSHWEETSKLFEQNELKKLK